MKLKNNTSLNNDLLREIINFVKPPRVGNFTIKFKKFKHFSGVHYRGKKPLIIVRVPEDKKIRTKPAVKWPGGRCGKGYLPVTCYTHEEAVVMITAHELRHAWQYIVPRGWRVWGARGRFSERDADAYAIQKMRQWRRRGIPVLKE